MAEKILKSLILVESAAKAKTIRKFVAGRYYSMVSTEGFLKDLPKSRIGVDDNYQPDYITVRGKGKLLAELRRETLNARRIFIATNPDAQGEFLARQYCEVFGINSLSHCRIVLNELTKEKFKEAFEAARPIDDKLADAFQAKQLIDKYVSHKVGEYLSRVIWRGVKVGRFRAILLRLIAAQQPAPKSLTIDKTLTPKTLQELAFKELNFSAGRTRFIAEQLYEGINFEAKGYGGLITYPHEGEIALTTEQREPDAVKDYLSDYQFKLYSLIHARLADKKSARIKLDDTLNDGALMATFDKLGVEWSEYLAGGIASLIKRKYITAEDSTYKVTALGQRVLKALEGFFDDVFSAEAYNEVTAQVKAIAAGEAQKFSVIENYCAKFNAAFDKAMSTLGEDAQPLNEPVVESDEVCDKCGRKMLIRRGRYGTFLACSGYPDCKSTKPLLERLDKACPKCGGQLAKRFLTRGRIFYQCEACDFSTWDEPQARTCKTCGSTMFVHKFKDRAPMLYCGKDDCPTRANHPMNKILSEIKRRAEARKARKSRKALEATP